METPADYFARVKDNHRQALKMLGHPASRASKTSKSSTDASATTQARTVHLLNAIERSSAPITPGEISRLLLISRTRTISMLAELEREGLVTSDPSLPVSADGALYELTDTGIQRLGPARDDAGPDFLDEVIEESTARNPEFPELMDEARRRREQR